MKRLSILLTIFLLITQVSLQSQVRSDKTVRNNPAYDNSAFKSGCGVPTGIFVDEITSTSATLHWATNGARQYKIMIVNTDRPQEKGTLHTPLGSVAFDNLTPGCTYQVTIIARCEDRLYRSYPVRFTTLGIK